MNTVTLKTIGSAPSQEVIFSAKDIADYIQSEISGYPADEIKYQFISQEFVDKYSFIARYTSGTHLGFKYNTKMEDELFDEYRSFGK